MAKRHFKIKKDEANGIIKVNVTNTMIYIQLLDDQKKQKLLGRTYIMSKNSYLGMKAFLNELTNANQSENIMEYIDEKSNLTKQLFS